LMKMILPYFVPVTNAKTMAMCMITNSTPADTNSAYGLWHPGKESFAHGKNMPIGNVCLWANTARQIFPRFFPGVVWKQVTMRDEFC